jgi:mutual gliding-motility protein MglA
MSIINYNSREVLFKIAICGPPHVGKATTLRRIHAGIDAASTSELKNVANGEDRTLSFEFTPKDTALLDGFSIRIQLCTVTGNISQELTLKRTLRDADGILFTADSQWERQEENAKSFKAIEEHFKKLGNPIDEFPVVLQYNKRDLPDIAPVHYLDFVLNNHKKRFPTIETIATNGANIFHALRTLAELLIVHFNASSNAKPADKA